METKLRDFRYNVNFTILLLIRMQKIIVQINILITTYINSNPLLKLFSETLQTSKYVLSIPPPMNLKS